MISVLEEDLEGETEESRKHLRRDNQRRLRSQTTKRKATFEEPIDPSRPGIGEVVDSGPSSRRSLRQSTLSMPAGVYTNPWLESNAWFDSNDSSDSDELSEPEDSAIPDGMPGSGNTSSSEDEEPPTKRRRIALINKLQAPQRNENISQVIIDLVSEDELLGSRKDEGLERKRQDNSPSRTSTSMPLFSSILE